MIYLTTLILTLIAACITAGAIALSGWLELKFVYQGKFKPILFPRTYTRKEYFWGITVPFICYVVKWLGVIAVFFIPISRLYDYNPQAGTISIFLSMGLAMWLFMEAPNHISPLTRAENRYMQNQSWF